MKILSCLPLAFQEVYDSSLKTRITQEIVALHLANIY